MANRKIKFLLWLMPETILSMLGDRIAKLFFKQAVEQNACKHILASDTDIDAAIYQQAAWAIRKSRRHTDRFHFQRLCVSRNGAEFTKKNSLQA